MTPRPEKSRRHCTRTARPRREREKTRPGLRLYRCSVAVPSETSFALRRGKTETRGSARIARCDDSGELRAARGLLRRVPLRRREHAGLQAARRRVELDVRLWRALPRRGRAVPSARDDVSRWDVPHAGPLRRRRAELVRPSPSDSTRTWNDQSRVIAQGPQPPASRYRA